VIKTNNILKKTIKTKFETYLKHHFPSADLKNIQSFGAAVEMRFELGDKLPNGSKKRVRQATDRALRIFQATFPLKEELIWLLSYEFTSEFEIYKTENTYFNTLINSTETKGLIQFESKVKTGYVVDEIEEEAPVKMTMALVSKNQLNLEPIFEGIGNLEMGLDPAIAQKIYFFSNESNNYFHMYDDRGCRICADVPEKIRPIFEKYNSWIVEYYRSRIEAQFR
jgi:hypothetical protein